STKGRMHEEQGLSMGLGNKKGHVHGSHVSGALTTLIDGADQVVKKLGVLSWFESVRPGIISVAKGGKLSVTIRRPPDTTHVNTVKESHCEDEDANRRQDEFRHA